MWLYLVTCESMDWQWLRHHTLKDGLPGVYSCILDLHCVSPSLPASCDCLQLDAVGAARAESLYLVVLRTCVSYG